MAAAAVVVVLLEGRVRESRGTVTVHGEGLCNFSLAVESEVVVLVLISFKQGREQACCDSGGGGGCCCCCSHCCCWGREEAVCCIITCLPIPSLIDVSTTGAHEDEEEDEPSDGSAGIGAAEAATAGVREIGVGADKATLFIVVVVVVVEADTGGVNTVIVEHFSSSALATRGTASRHSRA